MHVYFGALGRTAWLAFLLLVAQTGWSERPEPELNLSSLFEHVFQGSRDVHVPKKLLTTCARSSKVASIALNGRDPLDFGIAQGYFFPSLTNDDESYFYFDPYYGIGPLRLDKGARTPVLEAFRYDKKAKKISIVKVQGMEEYLKNKVFGFYKNLDEQSDGVVRIDTEKSRASTIQGSKLRWYDIANPKDIDLGVDLVILSRLQHTTSDFPYMQSGRNVELSVYSRTEKAFLTSFTLPFTGSYLSIKTVTVPLQSVLAMNYVYLVLNPGMLDMATLTVPQSPRRWHVLIYDLKNDTLYSVWHGMDESDGLPDLSFSYYLGLERLYFEVLKQGKIEIYLVDIDLEKATPLREYETVDLLWNNKGLKEKWTEKIHEARSNDASFEQRWE